MIYLAAINLAFCGVNLLIYAISGGAFNLAAGVFCGFVALWCRP